MKNMAILTNEQVIDNWSFLIEKGNGKAEEIFSLTENFIKDAKAPSLRIKREEISPGVKHRQKVCQYVHIDYGEKKR